MCLETLIYLLECVPKESEKWNTRQSQIFHFNFAVFFLKYRYLAPEFRSWWFMKLNYYPQASIVLLFHWSSQQKKSSFRLEHSRTLGFCCMCLCNLVVTCYNHELQGLEIQVDRCSCILLVILVLVCHRVNRSDFPHLWGLLELVFWRQYFPYTVQNMRAMFHSP